MLDRQAVLRLLSAKAPELHALGARWLALFGSSARDEASAESDVDLEVGLGGAEPMAAVSPTLEPNFQPVCRLPATPVALARSPR